MPISTIDNFFHNSALKLEHDRFLSSVRNVLKNWGVSDVKDEVASYRSLRRSASSSEENQALTFNDEENCHKVFCLKVFKTEF